MPKVEVPAEIFNLLTHSGRSDFRLIIQNEFEGVLDCFIAPHQRAVNDKTIQFVIVEEKS